MNLKNLLKKKEKKKSVEIKNLSQPKVIFKDLLLHVTVGQWLNLLSSQKVYSQTGIQLYSHLSAEELISKKIITVEMLNEISEKFSLVLKLLGVSSDDTCIISQYDKDNFSFNCHFENENKDVKMSLRWGSFLDSGPEIIIDYPEVSKTYDYIEEYKDKPVRVNLQHYTLKNQNNGNTCYRYLSPYRSYFTLNSDNYSLDITISRPEYIKTDISSDYIFAIKNETELEQYLLGLSFPISIDEVYKNICELSLDSICNYPKIEIKAEKRLDKNTTITTDLILLESGEMSKFIITRNGKTISIDKQNNWSYKTDELSVSQDSEGKVNYNLHSIQREEIANLKSTLEQVATAEEEVQQVKRLTRTIIKNNN